MNDTLPWLGIGIFVCGLIVATIGLGLMGKKPLNVQRVRVCLVLVIVLLILELAILFLSL